MNSHGFTHSHDPRISPSGYLAALCLSALVLLGAVAALNYRQDPANLFHHRYEHYLAASLLAGRSAPWLENCDERLLQRLVAEGLAKRPEVLVLGSSRMSGFSGRWLPGRRVLNQWVSGGSLEDYLAIYEIHRARGREPAMVIVGLDPWALQESQSPARLWPMRGYLAQICGQLNVGQGYFTRLADWWLALSHRYMQLISLAYTRASLRELASGRGSNDFSGMNRDDIGSRRPDGSLLHSPSSRNRPRWKVTELAVAYGRDMNHGPDYSRIDRRLALALKRWVQDLHRRGIEVVFYLPPFHPKVVSLWRERRSWRYISEQEKTIRSWGRAWGVPVLGSYDPALSGCGAKDFIDGVHARSSCLRRGLAALGTSSLLTTRHQAR